MIVKFLGADEIGTGGVGLMKTTIIDNVDRIEVILHYPLALVGLCEEDPEEERVKAILDYGKMMVLAEDRISFLPKADKIGNKGFREFSLWRHDGSIKQVLTNQIVYVMNDEGKTIEKY